MDQPNAPTDPTSPAPDGGLTVARLVQRLRGVLLIGAGVIATDQLSKALVRDRLSRGDHWPEGADLLRFSHIENSGAAFGILEGAGGFLLISTLIGIGAIVAYVLYAPAGDWRYTLGLGAILGGAIGNLIDRVRLGAVTDFIDPAHYPAFNIADSAIVVGVIGLIVLSLFDPPEAA